MNSETYIENPDEPSDDSPIPLYEIKAKIKSLDGDIRSVHYKNTVSYQEICRRVSRENPNLLKAEVQICVELFLTEVVRCIIEDGQGVRIDKFGIFEARPKKSKRIYIPALGEERWIKAGAKFSFKPSRNLADYFREYGRKIYYRTKQREEAVQAIKAERNKLQQEKAIQLGWHKPLYYKPVEELKENTLRMYTKRGTMQERLQIDLELKAQAEEATKDREVLDNEQNST